MDDQVTMYRVVMLDRAYRDLDGIYEYIETKAGCGPQVASGWWLVDERLRKNNLFIVCVARQ